MRATDQINTSVRSLKRLPRARPCWSQPSAQDRHLRRTALRVRGRRLHGPPRHPRGARPDRGDGVNLGRGDRGRPVPSVVVVGVEVIGEAAPAAISRAPARKVGVVVVPALPPHHPAPSAHQNTSTRVPLNLLRRSGRERHLIPGVPAFVVIRLPHLLAAAQTGPDLHAWVVIADAAPLVSPLVQPSVLPGPAAPPATQHPPAGIGVVVDPGPTAVEPQSAWQRQESFGSPGSRIGHASSIRPTSPSRHPPAQTAALPRSTAAPVRSSEQNADVAQVTRHRLGQCLSGSAHARESAFCRPSLTHS